MERGIKLRKRIFRIFPHAVVMVGRTIKSYALLSVTIVLSFSMLLGYLLYRLIDNFKNKLPKFFKTEGFMNFFVIVILILFILYLCDLHMVEWLNY